MTLDEFAAARLPALVAYAHLLTGDAERARLLVEEALIRAGMTWSRVVRDSDPEAFVRATVVALHLSRWSYRGDKREVSPSNAALDRDGFDLMRALDGLPRRLRVVTVLREIDGMPDAEIARLLGCSERRVRAHAAAAAALIGPASEDDQHKSVRDLEA